jgi:hypothetical protein
VYVVHALEQNHIQKIYTFLLITELSAKNTHEGVKVQLRAFLPSSLDGCEWSDSRSGLFTTCGKIPSYQLDRRLVRSEIDLDVEVKRKNLPPLSGIQPQTLRRPGP